MAVRRRHLPHWDVPGATYFVTACLAGSIPAQGFLEIERYRATLTQRKRPADVTPQSWKITCWKQVFARSDEWMDLWPAVRHLADQQLAKVVADSVYHFAGERYDLLAYAVMPSHLHWVFRPIVGQVCSLSLENEKGTDSSRASARQRIMHSLKRHTARQCNRHLGLIGAFWQDESYDHCIRDDEELMRVIEYVEQNPVKAGLAKTAGEWLFSSAHDRIPQPVPFGAPLLRRTGM